MKISGGRFIAETVKGYGVTHVFFMEAILRETLLEMEALGMPRVLAHTEKGAAYMADGYARVGRRPGLCMAQSVGAANLAAGLQDPYLGGSPVIAITGRRSPMELHRNSYQEIDHRPLFEAVTKFNVVIETAEHLPFLLRQGLAGDSERLDPDDAYYMRLHSSEIGKNNWSQYSNKEMDELLEKGRTTWKWEDRVPIYKKVVEIIREDLPILYLFKAINPIAHWDYVKGHKFGMATWFGYHGGGMKKVWLDK